jgi:hypothetical protein
LTPLALKIENFGQKWSSRAEKLATGLFLYEESEKIGPETICLPPLPKIPGPEDFADFLSSLNGIKSFNLKNGNISQLLDILSQQTSSITGCLLQCPSQGQFQLNQNQ